MNNSCTKWCKSWEKNTALGFFLGSVWNLEEVGEGLELEHKIKTKYLILTGLAHPIYLK